MTDLALRDRLLQLSVAERLELIAELWDSIATETEQQAIPLTDAQRDEVTRRLRELDAHPERAIPWDEARELLRTRRGE